MIKRTDDGKPITCLVSFYRRVLSLIRLSRAFSLLYCLHYVKCLQGKYTKWGEWASIIIEFETYNVDRFHVGLHMQSRLFVRFLIAPYIVIHTMFTLWDYNLAVNYHLLLKSGMLYFGLI